MLDYSHTAFLEQFLCRLGDSYLKFDQEPSLAYYYYYELSTITHNYYLYETRLILKRDVVDLLYI